jgi:hypothetical protein
MVGVAALAAVALFALGIPTIASALPTGAETINVSWHVVTPEPTSSPFRGLGSGTFAATGVISDSGALAAAVQDVAVPSQTHGASQISFTLTGNAGTGTLNLRCTQTETDFSDPTAIPGTGPCTITGGGTGVYAHVQGSGTMSSLTNGNAHSQSATIELTIS